MTSPEGSVKIQTAYLKTSYVEMNEKNFVRSWIPVHMVIPCLIISIKTRPAEIMIKIKRKTN